jgi:hypothetical protein
MEATLEGQDINVHIRTSKVSDDELKCWPDSLADDYIHRPLQIDFEGTCFYDMTCRTRKYTRVTNQNPFKCMNSVTVIQDISSVIYPN